MFVSRTKNWIIWTYRLTKSEKMVSFGRRYPLHSIRISLHSVRISLRSMSIEARSMSILLDDFVDRFILSASRFDMLLNSCIVQLILMGPLVANVGTSFSGGRKAFDTVGPRWRLAEG